MLAGNVWCLATNPASIFVLTIIEDVSGRPEQRANPASTIARPTGPQQGVMYPGLIFQQNNAKSHTTRVAMNCLTTYQILSWPAKSPDPSPIEHVWNKMGRRMLMIWTDNWSKFGRNSAGDHQGEL
ncbi:transposable element Tc1 transposase [Trichonephila clavipes]|nr:transposable element Tc1 transposase [Trichonephila clavipes]